VGQLRAAATAAANRTKQRGTLGERRQGIMLPSAVTRSSLLSMCFDGISELFGLTKLASDLLLISGFEGRKGGCRGGVCIGVVAVCIVEYC